MDEAEHDIRIMLVEKCFILRKPHPITVFCSFKVFPTIKHPYLDQESFSLHDGIALSSSVSGYGSVHDYKIFAKGCSL